MTLQSSKESPFLKAPAEVAAAFHRSDHGVFGKVWNALSEEASAAHVSTLSRDYSENGFMLMAGRFLLPDAGRPAYWAVKDNRAYFSCRFDALSEQDKLLLVNQILIASIPRSVGSGNVKSAALAVTKKGIVYTGINTLEPSTMNYDKECAEDNVTRIVKEFNPAEDKIARLYVLGNLTDHNNRMHVDDHLIGMCMKCVERAKSVMAPDGQVTIIPANDGKTVIPLRICDDPRMAKPHEAIQVPYRRLKEPSIITFAPEVNERQMAAFDAMRNGSIPTQSVLEPYRHSLDPRKLIDSALSGEVSIPVLDANPTKEAANAFMMARLNEAVKKRHGNVSQMAIAVLEITEIDGHKRYEFGEEIKGADNSALTPLSVATMHSGLPRPNGDPRHAYISKIYFSGFNADGSPYDMNAEGSERALKRVGRYNADNVEVTFIPLNDGLQYPEGEKCVKITDMNLTDWFGSAQHSFHDRNGKGGLGCC